MPIARALITLSFLAGLAAVPARAFTPSQPVKQPELPPNGPSRQYLRAYGVPGHAMMPTLQRGEVALMDTSAYRGEAPKRGDIVIYSRDRAAQEWIAFRVIGIGGDRIALASGRIILNGKRLGERPTKRSGETRPGVRRPIVREVLPSGRSYLVLKASPNSSLANMAERVVPRGKFLLLGDNRDNAADSRIPSTRSGAGLVDGKEILGRVIWLYQSHAEARMGVEPDRAPQP